MKQWVYIARCSDDSLYTGMASDVDRRIGEHNAGTGAKYTRSRRPVEAVYREECLDKSTALKREAAIKRMTRAQKLELIDE
jgi:putative endonuclease